MYVEIRSGALGISQCELVICRADSATDGFSGNSLGGEYEVARLCIQGQVTWNNS